MKLYRYITYEKMGHNYEPSTEDYYPRLIEFTPVSSTARGYWIRDTNNKKRWVSSSGKKRYAYPSKQEAKENYILRTERYIRIMNFNIAKSKVCLKAIKSL